VIAGKYGIAGMDALHIAAALSIGAEEFITTEKKTKPMFRVTELQMISIAIS
jgi:predicted nucleic acid-binding protein